MRRPCVLTMIVGAVFGCVALAYPEDHGGLVGVRAVEASGNWFGFARMSDGTVYGWGTNYSGQLGDATTIQSDVPVKVQACRDAAGAFLRVTSTRDCGSQEGTLGDLSGVKKLNTGQNHTLALLDNGTPANISDDYVVAWGFGSRGQLGDGTPSSSRTAVRVACGEMAGTGFCSSAGTLQGAVAIAAGGGEGGSSGHSLALLSDGTVVGWGWNRFGQLGNGATGDIQSTPVRVGCGAATGAHCSADGDLVGVTSIEASAASSFAILSDSTMLAWGWNSFGWLGDGTTTNRPAPVWVSCGELAGTGHCSPATHLRGVVRLAKNSVGPHTLVLLSDGTAAAWGRGGRLGNGTDSPSYSPVRVRGLEGAGVLSGVTAVASGTLHSLALLSGGTVVAWGDNNAGQLGDGTTTARFAPVRVIGLSRVVEVAAGYDHSHALLSDGTVIGWGNNNTSQLGLEAAGGISTPVHVVRQGSPLSGVSALSAGVSFSRALQSDETLLAWGGNTSGQLGDGSTTNRLSPVQVLGLGSESGVTAMATGSAFSLVLKLDGTVLAWGSNASGQLGDGSTTNKLSPVQVSGLGPGSGVTAIASHPTAGHSLALKSDGAVLAWGANAHGQLGDGTMEDRRLPTQVLGLGTGSGVKAIAAGQYQSLALLSDGTVLEWGDGRTRPQPVVGLSGVTALGARDWLSLAVLSNGTLFEWRAGQTPVQRPDLTDVAAVTGGSAFTLALRSDGTVIAWGLNTVGQLGDGTTRAAWTPVEIMTCRDSEGALIATGTNSSCAALGGTLSELTDVTAVAAGYEHSLALLSDGTALAWGSRSSGALGDGSPGAFFTEPSVLMVLGSRDGKLNLMPGRALVVATESTIGGKIEGDFTNLVAVGSRATVEGKIKDIGSLVFDGSQTRVSDVFRVENARVTEHGSATVQGDLHVTSRLVLEAGSNLIVTRDLDCELDTSLELDPSATLDVQGRMRCPAFGAN